MLNKEILKAQIPHGRLKDVAKKAGVSTPAVTRFFNNLTKNSPKIYTAALEVALEYQKQVTQLETELSNLTAAV